MKATLTNPTKNPKNPTPTTKIGDTGKTAKNSDIASSGHNVPRESYISGTDPSYSRIRISMMGMLIMMRICRIRVWMIPMRRTSRRGRFSLTGMWSGRNVGLRQGIWNLRRNRCDISHLLRHPTLRHKLLQTQNNSSSSRASGQALLDRGCWRCWLVCWHFINEICWVLQLCVWRTVKVGSDRCEM